MHVTHQKYVVKWVQHDYYLLCDNKRCIVGKQQLNYWKAKNCHVFLSQISPRIKKDSQRIIRSTFDVFKKRSLGIDRKGSSGAPTKQHSSIISCCITIARPGRQAHTAQGSREGRRFLGTETGGGYGTHHIEAVIIGGKARRRIHARVLLLQNGRQRARRRDTKAGWLQCRAGEILHWISDWGNEWMLAGSVWCNRVLVPAGSWNGNDARWRSDKHSVGLQLRALLLRVR